VVVWYARSDDAGYAWREGGQWLLAALVPAGLIFCGSAIVGEMLSGPFWMAMAFLPVALAYAAWLVVTDRHAVVEVRIADGEFTLIRADRTTVAVPAREISLIEVLRTRYVGGSSRNSARLRLHIGKRVERTRPGNDLTPELATAIQTAEVDLRVTVKSREE
jgi:hypothetical protein